MIIDTSKLKNQYVYLTLDDGSKIHVKLDDEGIVVDHVVDDEVEESTWQTYQEMIDGDVEPEDTKYAITGIHSIHGEAEAVDITETKKNEIHSNMVYAGYTDIEIHTMEEWNKLKK